MLGRARFRRAAVGVLAVTCLLMVASCSGDDDTATPAPSRTPGSGAVPSEPEEGQVNRPREGSYVYRLSGTGENRPPAGTKLTQEVSIDGDDITSVIRNNKNANFNRIVQRWTNERILHVSSTTKIGDSEQGCTPRTPIEILRIPVKVENYPQQSWSGEGCAGNSEYRVTERRRVEDAGGRIWDTWRIEEKIDNPRREYLIHFFSPALGIDIRTQDQERLTLSVLESNPN